MSEEIQYRENVAQAGRPMPGSEMFAAAGQNIPHVADQAQDNNAVGSSADNGVDPCGPEESGIPSSGLPPAENKNVEDLPVCDSDPVEAQLIAKLEALLTKDAELSARYGVLLRNHRKTGRERRTIRGELRQLHTEEGRILLEVKLHLARKGRAGGWAEFLRQRKPKGLSRTTADRWIQWHLDSTKQEPCSEPSPEQVPENAPQKESGAISAGDAESQPTSSNPPQPGELDPPEEDRSAAFEDPQQVILLYKKSRAAHFKAAAEFMVTNIGCETVHEAVYLTLTEAAAKLGFVYPPATIGNGETNNAS